MNALLGVGQVSIRGSTVTMEWNGLKKSINLWLLWVKVFVLNQVVFLKLQSSWKI